MSIEKRGSQSFKGIIFDIVWTVYVGLWWVIFIGQGLPDVLVVLKDDQLIIRSLLIWLGIFFTLGFLGFTFLRRYQWISLGKLIFESELPDSSRALAYGQLGLFLLLTLWTSIKLTEFNVLSLLDADGFAGVVRLVRGLLNPNWKVLSKALINIVITVFMAFLATFLAIPVAFVLSFLAAKNLMNRGLSLIVYLGLRLLMNVSRSIEALIWAIIFSVWVGIGPFAGMLALMVHSIASLVKQYSEIIESVDEKLIESIQSTGANRIQVIWYAIVPQVILPFISFTIYRWDINIRMATIIGLVGGGGIGTMFLQYSGQAMWPEVGTIVFVIALAVWAMDALSAQIREALK